MSIPQCECAEGSNQRDEMWSDSAHVTRVIRFFSEFGSKFFRFEQNQSVCCQCCLRIPECRAVTVQRHSVKHWLGPARPSGAIRRLFKTFTIYFLNEKKRNHPFVYCTFRRTFTHICFFLTALKECSTVKKTKIKIQRKSQFDKN